MISTMQEIQERFNKIKDHKPKASKKLNELGEILASAYRIDANIADEMWQYIVDLNVTENISNAKFYIAQVFYKITERLSNEEATCLITMSPDRVYQMVMHGYDGYKLWDCLDTLIHGYIKANSPENAATCIEYFYDKFDGVSSGRKEIFHIARRAATICSEYIKNGEYTEDSEQLLFQIEHSENQEVNAIVEITKTWVISGECEDYDMLFYVAKKCKEPVEFFDLLWQAKEKYELDELRDKWVEYVEECEEGDIRPYNYIREEEDCDYDTSKLCFYVDMEKNESVLLDYYFSRPNLYDVEKGVVSAWVFEENWEFFVKYISQAIMASTDNSLDWTISNTLKEFMDACFYGAGRDSHDRYGRSYKDLMKSRANAFAEALAQISVITIGCSCHSGYLAFVKEFIQKLNGNLDILNEVGLDEEVETRSAEERLKEYVHNFLGSGNTVYRKKTTEYTVIMDALSEERIQKGYSIVDDEEAVEQSYRLASDDEIASFYFMHYPGEYRIRMEMLSACIKKNDVDRAIALVDMMSTTKGNKGYDDLNGWGRQNMLTFLYLIRLYDYSNKNDWEAAYITNDMRALVKPLVERIMPFLPSKSQDELQRDVYRVELIRDSFDTYIDKLLKDVDIYTTFPRPRGKGNAANVNALSWEITCCFEKLSSKGRFDVINQVMMKLASVRDMLKPITYSGWMRSLVRGVSEQDLLKLYKDYPEIFDVWINETNLRELEIREVADAIGSCCTRAEFTSFRNMVLANKGFIEGVDNCFKTNSQNTKTQLLFNGVTAKIELDYLEVRGSSPRGSHNPIGNINFHFLTTRKSTKLNTVKVVSCLINGIRTTDMGFGFGINNEYRVYEKHNEDELTIYCGFFEEHDICHVNTIELAMNLIDNKGNVVETIAPILIEFDIQTGEYIVK